MIFKKKEFFLLIFLIFLQSCSGGKIGTFLESSFNDLEKTSQDDNSQKNLENKKNLIQQNEDVYDKNYENSKTLDKLKTVLENKKVDVIDNKEIDDKNYENSKKTDKPETVLKDKKDQNSEKIQKQKNNKIKNSSKKRKIGLQSYKIIFILKDVDPKYPTEELSTILKNSEVDFEIEMIDRILD